MTRSLIARRRTLEAMGLGPLWVRRNRSNDAPGDIPCEPVSQAPSLERTASIARLGFDEMRAEVAGCVACPLSSTRTKTVFGVGAMRPEWLVVGDAPDIDDDLRGEPFVGQAGQLLDAMLAAVGLSRDRDVFVANVLKCRIPDDRDASPCEVESCRPFLERQIALLRPKLILVVGELAGKALLGGAGTEASRGRLHRLSIDGREIPAVATYHPTRLLRTAADKARAWEDLCLARRSYQTLRPEAD